LIQWELVLTIKQAKKRPMLKLKVPWIQHTTKSKRSKPKLSFELNGIRNPKPHEKKKKKTKSWMHFGFL
jgi:hypothetical protein